MMTKLQLVQDQLDTIMLKETLFAMGYDMAKKHNNLGNMKKIEHELKALGYERSLLEKEVEAELKKQSRRKKNG